MKSVSGVRKYGKKVSEILPTKTKLKKTLCDSQLKQILIRTKIGQQSSLEKLRNSVSIERNQTATHRNLEFVQN